MQVIFIVNFFYSLFFGKEPDGTRVLRPLPDAPAWSGCFDVVQLNEDEMKQLGDDPLEVAAGTLAQGCRTLVVTLAAKGAVYFTGEPVRTARIPAEGGPFLHDAAAVHDGNAVRDLRHHRQVMGDVYHRHLLIFCEADEFLEHLGVSGLVPDPIKVSL